MVPERVDNGTGGQDEHMVWALINKLDSVLSISAEFRWPISWFADPQDMVMFRSVRPEVAGARNLHLGPKRDGTIVYSRLRSVTLFLDSVRRVQQAQEQQHQSAAPGQQEQ